MQSNDYPGFLLLNTMLLTGPLLHLEARWSVNGQESILSASMARYSYADLQWYPSPHAPYHVRATSFAYAG